VALFRRNSQAAAPEPTTTINPVSTGKKDRPTPTRKEAEAARRQRMSNTLGKKEARAAASRQSRANRMKAIIFHKRMNGPRKSRVKVGIGPALLFALLAVVSAILGMLLEGLL